MISPRLYATLPAEERKLWHSHVFEVKSGMLIMPLPATAPMPTAAWEAAETAEMKDVIEIYGKVYHLWQTDRGDQVLERELVSMLTPMLTDEGAAGRTEADD